jgi:malate synthase
VWQWVRYGATLDGGTVCSPQLVRRVIEEECTAIRAELGGGEAFAAGGAPPRTFCSRATHI